MAHEALKMKQLAVGTVWLDFEYSVGNCEIFKSKLISNFRGRCRCGSDRVGSIFGGFDFLCLSLPHFPRPTFHLLHSLLVGLLG